MVTSSDLLVLKPKIATAVESSTQNSLSKNNLTPPVVPVPDEPLIGKKEQRIYNVRLRAFGRGTLFFCGPRMAFELRSNVLLN